MDTKDDTPNPLVLTTPSGFLRLPLQFRANRLSVFGEVRNLLSPRDPGPGSNRGVSRML
jgi:hypothetical protein